jgi:hypothetical protein
MSLQCTEGAILCVVVEVESCKSFPIHEFFLAVLTSLDLETRISGVSLDCGGSFVAAFGIALQSVWNV